MAERTRLPAPEATPAPPQTRAFTGPQAVPAPAPAPTLPKGVEGPAPEATKKEEASDLASIELTLTPMNLSWPKGPNFWNPGISAGLPFHVWEGAKWNFDIGPSLGFDFHFGETPVLPQTAGYTGATIRGSVDAALVYNFGNGHRFAIKLGSGGGHTFAPQPELVGSSVGVGGALEYSYEPRKGLQLFGGLRGGVDWAWAQAHPGEAEAAGSIGFGAGVTFGWGIGKKKPKTKEKVQPPPVVVKAPEAASAPAGPQTYSAAAVPRPVHAVMHIDEAEYTTLVDYIKRAAGEIRAVAANPPSHVAWMKTSTGIQETVARVDALVADLDARSLIVRFDLPAGQRTLAAYDIATNIMHLPPGTGGGMAELAASVIHEYVHVEQDRAVQKALSVARAPIAHTEGDELQNEIDAYVGENYFLSLLQQTSLREAFPLGDLMKVSAFTMAGENMRSGVPAKVAEGKKRVTDIVNPVKATQIATNAPRRIYRVEIDTANRASLITGAATSVDLGLIPQVVDRAQLETEIINALRAHYAAEIRALFTGGNKFVVLRVYQGTTELEEIELTPGTI